MIRINDRYEVEGLIISGRHLSISSFVMLIFLISTFINGNKYLFIGFVISLLYLFIICCILIYDLTYSVDEGKLKNKTNENDFDEHDTD